MQRYLDACVRADLNKKMVILTGPRQVGKTTLSRQLLSEFKDAQYFNYDVPEHRAVLENRTWNKKSTLLVFDEIHKMRQWKPWLKGVFDGRTDGQSLLVTGSARMDTFRQSGESLAGRYYKLRLHPISVREWCEQTGAAPEDALSHLLQRGGFPEPCLADTDEEAARWRAEYFSDLVREDVLEFSRLQEITTMRLFAELLRSRVGSPLSLASMGRDLAISPGTLKKYLDILEALFIVFTVRPWHRNIARATLQAPKVYFYDTGLVKGDDGVRFENFMACSLLKHVEWQQDALGKEAGLHYIRTKDGAEVDFALSHGDTLTDLVECKLSDAKPHRALLRFAGEWPQARASQVLRGLSHAMDVGPLQIREAAGWLMELSA
ncbi:MAG: ATP-binding protein [Pseudomonadota bacterium]|uniref:ATP-binding protein n=1 Tax=Polaromonas sp. TaxID=1869339 RepID=UPI00181D08BA|nr:ATP-binding protein [Polaromonas sp.]MBA3592406.1 ATP-binding protein [Polaromonas sp.]MDQ3270600.1 ATP-binding protein [Pseudomonadota bacterium]